MTSMDDEVVVKLTDDELIERALTMAQKNLHIEKLRKKKSKDSHDTQQIIDHELDEVARLSRVLVANEEARKQGDLNFGDEIATTVLAEVARRAGEGGNGAAESDGDVSSATVDRAAQMFVDSLTTEQRDANTATINNLIGAWMAEKGITKAKGALRRKVKELLGSQPPASLGTSDEPPAEEAQA